MKTISSILGLNSDKSKMAINEYDNSDQTSNDGFDDIHHDDDGLSSPLELEYKEKALEADRIAKKISIISDSISEFSKFTSESSVNILSISKFIETSRAEIKQHSKILGENTSLKSEIISANTNLGEQKRELDAAHYEITSLKKIKDELQQSLTETKELAQELDNKNNSMTSSFREVTLEKRELNEKLIRLADIFEALDSKFKLADSQRTTYKTELDSLTKELAKFEALIVTKDDTIASQDQQAKAYNTEISSLNRHITELEYGNISFQTKYDQQVEEFNSLKRKLEHEQRKQDNETYALRAEIDNVKSRWDMSKASLKESTNEIRSLTEQNRNSKTRILELEKQILEVQSEREDHREEVEAQSEKIHDLSLKYDASIIELKQEKIQNAQLNQTVDKMAKKIKDNDSLRIRYDASLKQIDELNELIRKSQIGRTGSEKIDSHLPDNEEENDMTNVVALGSDK